MTRAIRYFATNRDRESLGKIFGRNERIKLQGGGHHWLDTDACMAQYLGTTDATRIPLEAVIPDSAQAVYEAFLCQPCVRKIVIGIHGFNVPLHGAITSFSLLAESLQQEVSKRGFRLLMEAPETGPVGGGRGPDSIAFVGFSWPSDGSVLAYQADRLEAAKSTSALSNLIAQIRARNPRAKITVIAHSMGNFLTCTMLGELIDHESWPPQAYADSDTGKWLQSCLLRRDQGGGDASFIDQYIMLAPDVERREVTQCRSIEFREEKLDYNGPFYGGLLHLVGHSHLFYSRSDSALKASVVEKDAVREPLQKVKDRLIGVEPETMLDKRWESSLGLNPLPSLAPRNMTGHNATLLTNRPIDHGDYFDAPEVIRVIADLLVEDLGVAV
jgi:esterase/lipase superfamily enzyme